MNKLTKAGPFAIVDPNGDPLDLLRDRPNNFTVDVGGQYAAMSSENTRMQTEAAIETERLRSAAVVKVAQEQREAAAIVAERQSDAEKVAAVQRTATAREQAKPELLASASIPVIVTVGVIGIGVVPPEKATAIAVLVGVALAALVGPKILDRIKPAGRA